MFPIIHITSSEGWLGLLISGRDYFVDVVEQYFGPMNRKKFLTFLSQISVKDASNSDKTELSNNFMVEVK